ncbi:DUF1836 domain-containing protein [Ruminiclostridium cellobioparum]|uniref:DUF1836 domain-containing protein n=1 Tax=Ruminiclostridium cellobioparum TaxID=29355 RepID=UPI0004809613|nr:DUF1836 domain-containing protein [Ruminiclostridium cellobioparum]
MKTDKINSIKQELSDFSHTLSSFTTESWSQFPGIDLYMDQVVTYLERLLKLFDTDASGKVITSSMVNNYVKEGYLKRPVNKKYDRVHLVTLYIMSMLKPILPIPLIAGSLSNLTDEQKYQSFFEELTKLQDEAFANISGKLSATLEQLSAEDYETTLRLFALQLTSEANARKIVAEKILLALSKDTGKAAEKK